MGQCPRSSGAQDLSWRSGHQIDAPLFWANAAEIRDRVLAEVDQNAEIKALILDLEATSQLDTTSIDSLELLLTQLQDRGIKLHLVRVFYQARQVLAGSGFVDLLGEQRMWHSISAGVRAARTSANLTDPSQTQVVDDETGELYEATAERIAVEIDRNGDKDEGPDTQRAPRGRYQDTW